MWYNYRKFIKPNLFLHKLFERFDVPSIKNVKKTHIFSDEAFYMVEIRRDIQHRVARALYHWVHNYLFDFDDKMISDLENFVTTKLKPVGFRLISDQIITQLKNVNL